MSDTLTAAVQTLKEHGVQVTDMSQARITNGMYMPAEIVFCADNDDCAVAIADIVAGADYPIISLLREWDYDKVCCGEGYVRMDPLWIIQLDTANR